MMRLWLGQQHGMKTVSCLSSLKHSAMQNIFNNVVLYTHLYFEIFVPPPSLFGAGDIMLLCHVSVCALVRACVHAFIHPWSCFCSIYSMHKFLSVKHLGTKMNRLGFGIKQSKVWVTVWPNVLKTPFWGVFMQCNFCGNVSCSLCYSYQFLHLLVN